MRLESNLMNMHSFDPNDKKTRLQNNRKCKSILKKGLEIATTKQQQQFTDSKLSQKQKQALISTITSLRAYFPSEKGYNLAKIIHSLNSKLVKNPTKIQQSISPIKRYLHSPSTSKHHLHTLPKPQQTILQTKLPIQKSARIIAIVKCFQKYGPSYSKVIKFLKKANSTIKIETESEYVKLLEEVIVDTIKYLQKELLGGICEVRMAIEVKMTEIKTKQDRKLGEYFSKLLNEIVQNRILKLISGEKNIISQNQQTLRSTFFIIMKHKYGIVHQPQQQQQSQEIIVTRLSQFDMLKLYEMLCSEIAKMVNEENGQQLVIIKYESIKRNQLKNAQQSVEYQIDKAFYLTISQSVWQNDKLYLKICQTWCQQKQLQQTQQQQSSEKEEEIAKIIQKQHRISQLLKTEYGYDIGKVNKSMFQSEDNQNNSLMNLLCGICLTVVKKMFFMTFGKKATQRNVRMYRRHQGNTDLLQQPQVQSFALQTNTLLPQFRQQLSTKLTNPKPSPPGIQTKHRTMGILFTQQQFSQGEKCQNLISELMKLGFDCQYMNEMGRTSQQVSQQMETNDLLYEIKINNEHVLKKLLLKYIKLSDRLGDSV